jgi:hypothetical protein
MSYRNPTTGFKSYYERMIPKYKGKFTRLPRDLIDTAVFRNLSGDSVKVLWYLMSRYYPNNNGSLTILPKEYEQWGMSKYRYGKALAELKAENLVFQTNGNNYTIKDCFAVTWLPVQNPLPAFLSTSGMITKEIRLIPFARFPIDVINTRKFASLSGDAVKVMTYMVADWRESKGIRAKGYTLNGYLQCSYELKSSQKTETQMFKSRGFTEKRLIKARQELLDVGFIVCTYKGKPHRPKDVSGQYSYKDGYRTIRQQVLPSLYAFTWGEYHIIPPEVATLMQSLHFKAHPSSMLSDDPATFPIDAWMDAD